MLQLVEQPGRQVLEEPDRREGQVVEGARRQHRPQAELTKRRQGDRRDARGGQRLGVATRLGGEVLVAGQQQPTREGADGLEGRDADDAGGAQGAYLAAAPPGPDALRRVLDERQAPCPADARDGIHVARHAVEVRCQHGHGARADGCLEGGRIEVAGSLTVVCEDRLQAPQQDHVDDVGDGDRRQHHLPAPRQVEGTEERIERHPREREGHRPGDTETCRARSLESGHPRPAAHALSTEQWQRGHHVGEALVGDPTRNPAGTSLARLGFGGHVNAR